MGFFSDTALVPHFKCYQDVVDRFNSAKHIRNSSENERRLCDSGMDSDKDKNGRRQKHKLLKRVPITADCYGEQMYEVSLHDNTIVEYHPTYYAINMCGWNSTSTIGMLEKLTGSEIHPFNPHAYAPKGFPTTTEKRDHRRGYRTPKVTVRFKRWEMKIPVITLTSAVAVWFPEGRATNRVLVGRTEFNDSVSGYLIDDSKKYTFNYDNTPIDTKQFAEFHKCKVNRKELNKVRKEVKPFVDYVKATLTLTSNDGGKSVPCGLKETHLINHPIRQEVISDYIHNLKASEMYSLIYFYCQLKKSKEVKNYFDSIDEGRLWAEMLDALKIEHHIPYRSIVFIEDIMCDLDKIMKHANPRTLVRVS